jgi:hypothetical protein
MYTRKNRSKSNKSVTTSSSSSVCDRVVNLNDDYEKAPSNVKVINQTKPIRKIEQSSLIL